MSESEYSPLYIVTKLQEEGNLLLPHSIVSTQSQAPCHRDGDLSHMQISPIDSNISHCHVPSTNDHNEMEEEFEVLSSVNDITPVENQHIATRNLADILLSYTDTEVYTKECEDSDNEEDKQMEQDQQIEQEEEEEEQEKEEEVEEQEKEEEQTDDSDATDVPDSAIVVTSIQVTSVTTSTFVTLASIASIIRLLCDTCCDITAGFENTFA